MPRTMTAPQAAEYVGVSKTMMDDFRSKGGGPRYIKIGRRVLYDVADLDAWIESKKQISTADIPELRRPQRKIGVAR